MAPAPPLRERLGEFSTPSTAVAASEEAQPSPPQPGGLLDWLVDRINPHYAILLLLPCLLFLINPNWLFQGFGHMDPWYYFGMSIDFPRYFHLGSSYAGERLPWVLPARLFVALFSPVYGWMSFHFCVYCISVLCFYTIIRSLFGVATAFLGAIMMACHPLFIGANGWSYVDSGSIAYLLLSLAAIVYARCARHPFVYIAVAGAFWSAGAFTYPLWWILTPCCALFYWGTADTAFSNDSLPKSPLNRYLASSGYFTIGIALTTCLMVTCHYLIHGSGGGFFYAGNLGMITFHLSVKKEQVNWGSQSYAWLKTAGWIVFPALVFLGSVIALGRHMFLRKRLGRISMGIVLTYVYACVALLYLQVRNTHALEFDYYVSILIPLEFLVLCALVFRVPSNTSTRGLYAVATIAAAIALAPLWRVSFYTPGFEPTLLWHYIVGLMVVTASLFRKNRRVWAGAAIGLSLASFGLVPAYPNQAWSADFNGLASMKRVGEAIQAIDANTPIDKSPVLWLDDFNDPYTVEYRSIMCGLLSHGNSMMRYPAVDPNAKYAPGTELILITRDKGVFESANAAMTRAGMPLRMWKQQIIFGEGSRPSSPVSYWLTFTEVLEAPKVSVAKDKSN